MNQWTVLNSLRQITPLDDEGAALALPLCLGGLDEIRAGLRSGVNEDDPRVARAAAGIAFYRLTLANAVSDGDMTSFKAGDVVVDRDPEQAISLAQRVRDEALLAATPLMRDDGFVFTGT